MKTRLQKFELSEFAKRHLEPQGSRRTPMKTKIAKATSVLMICATPFAFFACDSQVSEKAADSYSTGTSSTVILQKQNNLDGQVAKIGNLVNKVVNETAAITAKVNDPNFSIFTIFDVLKKINDSVSAQAADSGPTTLVVEGVFQIPYSQLSGNCQQFTYQVTPMGDLQSGTLTYSLKTCLQGDVFTPVLITHFDQNQVSLEFLQSNLQSVMPDPLISFHSGSWAFDGQLKELNCKNLILGQLKGLKLIASLKISPLSSTTLIEFDASAVDSKTGAELWSETTTVAPNGASTTTSNPSTGDPDSGAGT